MTEEFFKISGMQFRRLFRPVVSGVFVVVVVFLLLCYAASDTYESVRPVKLAGKIVSYEKVGGEEIWQTCTNEKNIYWCFTVTTKTVNKGKRKGGLKK